MLLYLCINHLSLLTFMVSIISMTSETPSKRREEEGRTSGKIEDANRIKINNQYQKLTINTKINNQYQRELPEQTVHPELTEC